MFIEELCCCFGVIILFCWDEFSLFVKFIDNYEDDVIFLYYW